MGTSKNPKIAVVTTLWVGEPDTDTYQIMWRDWNDKLIGTTTHIEKKLESIKFSFDTMRKIDAGMKFDFIFIDNGTENKEALEYYRKLPNYYRRENKDFSFGGYRYAWEKFGSKYDYYLFHEQDWGAGTRGWLKMFYQRFHEKEYVGAVGNALEVRMRKDRNPEVQKQMNLCAPEKQVMYNLDGACTFTSSEVLKNCPPNVLDLDKMNLDPTYNELSFQQNIVNAGYQLDSFDRDYAVWLGVQLKEPILGRSVNLNKLPPLINATTYHLNDRIREYYNTTYSI